MDMRLLGYTKTHKPNLNIQCCTQGGSLLTMAAYCSTVCHGCGCDMVTMFKIVKGAFAVLFVNDYNTLLGNSLNNQLPVVPQ